MSATIFDNISLQLDYPVAVANNSHAYLSDISGRDSIAAIVSMIDRFPSAIIVPSIVVVPAEFGDRRQYGDVVKDLCRKFGNRVVPAIVCETHELWKHIVGEGMHQVAARYDFNPICIVCHLVLHLVRIRLANQLGLINVISGERESHSGRMKINQLGLVLDFYNSLYQASGVQHHQPLRYVSETSEIEQIVAKHDLSSVQLDCAFGGNYFQSPSQTPITTETQIFNYISEHLSPLIESFDKRLSLDCSIIR